MPVSDDLTRRMALGLILAAGPGAAVAARLPHPPVPLAARLGADLAAVELPGPGATLTLLRFTEEVRAGQTALFACARMDWPPGRRQQAFHAADIDPEAAYATLLNEIADTFRAAQN